MKSDFSTPGFLWPLLTLICTIVILYGLNRALKKTEWATQRRQKIFFVTTATILTWMALLTVLSYKGFFADFSKLPPRPVLAVLIPLPFVLIFSFSKTGTELLQLIPAQWLVLMQPFRIFVEVLIWFAFLANKLPVQMSFEGKNFDVLTGILALPIGYLLIKRKTYSPKIIIVFNVVVAGKTTLGYTGSFPFSAPNVCIIPYPVQCSRCCTFCVHSKPYIKSIPGS